MEFREITDSISFSDFVRNHVNDDPATLRLKYRNKPLGFDPEFAIMQIESRKRFRKKLQEAISCSGFLFPSVLSGEQASHESVASFHSSLIPDNATVADLTAGLGIDAFTIASKAGSVTALEIDSLKAEILSLNSKEMGIANLNVVNADSIKWLQENPDRSFDIVFIDPARRGDGNSRLYNLRDCSPDIILNQDMLLGRTKAIFVKASPMLDISQTLRDFPSVSSIKCVSVDGECKEVLLELRKNCRHISFDAINLHSDGEMISRFTYSSEEQGKETLWADMTDLRENTLLYEPDASMMKFSPWKIISQRFDPIKKLGPSSHLFVSDSLFSDFPGRILRLKGVLTKKDLKPLKGEKINVAVRNYPIAADLLRKKLSLQEGEDMFLYGTRIGEVPILLLAERVRSTQ